MKKLLNTLYITSPDSYLSLDGENVVVQKNKEVMGRIPLHNLEAITAFGYTGASPALMGKCAGMNIALTFLSSSGKFYAKITGKSYGNIMLRREQYRISDSEEKSVPIAQNFIIGKIYNQKSVIQRAIRDYPMRVDVERLRKVSKQLQDTLKFVYRSDNISGIRGYEGEAAALYFSMFDSLILQQKEAFIFDGRNRRPPTDRVNAMLSFAYTLLTGMCVSALETVDLGPYAGFMHTDRPGRVSLALDLVEELRAPFADRFVLSVINKKMISEGNFLTKENGVVLMDEKCRKTFLDAWQSKKMDKITHPYLQEKVEWGMVPYIQAMLLARYIRGDVDEYPSFFWK